MEHAVVTRPGIHLIAPAGSCRPFFSAIGVDRAADLLAIVQATVGSTYTVTGNEAIIEAGEDENRGGRADDRERARDLQDAMADDAVAAIVLIRGGAWFSRVLPLIDFSVLEDRRSRVAVIGFSELTTLVNIVGTFTQAIGIYDMGPAFLTYGLKRRAALREHPAGTKPPNPQQTMLAELRPAFEAFFRDVVAMINGRGSQRCITAQLVAGELPETSGATFVGGNLTVLSTLIGSRYQAAIEPTGRWLTIEDFNDRLERIDRFLAHLTLAGYWHRCEGLLLGDFHRGYDDLTPAVRELLRYHLPADMNLPILVTKDIGHVWPMSPLPLHIPASVKLTDADRFAITWPAAALKTVG